MSWSGFHRLPRRERLERVRAYARLDDEGMRHLTAESALPQALSEQFIENALGSYPLPLGLAVNFVVDGVPVAVPMAVEESSVVAAASHGAKLAAAGGGFHTAVMPPVTIGQVELRAVPDVAAATRKVTRLAPQWTRELDGLIPNMVARGGGVRGIDARRIGPGHLVLHVRVDTRDAMGANTVNTLCEHLGPIAAEALGAQRGLCILSNLADQRLATARARIPLDALGGKEAADGIVAANRFAERDPYRAATHNKGILNGIDPVAIATGNDWRAIEAGAHAFAAARGRYGPLTDYKRTKDALECSLTLPLALGTVGGVTRLHPTARVALRILGDPDSARLSAICASVGLAQNLAALKALSGEGIQKGHMALHKGNLELAKTVAGATPSTGKRRRAATEPQH